MADWIKWDEEQKVAWDEWVATRPESVQELCKKLPGNKLDRIKKTLQCCTIYSYHENGTLTVRISPEYNPDNLILQITGERGVFGYTPDSLEECELPEGVAPKVGCMGAEDGYL
jgi:hypothetical protein